MRPLAGLLIFLVFLSGAVLAGPPLVRPSGSLGGAAGGLQPVPQETPAQGQGAATGTDEEPGSAVVPSSTDGDQLNRSQLEAKLAEAKSLPAESTNRDALIGAYESAISAVLEIAALQEERRELGVRAAKAKEEVPRLEAEAEALREKGPSFPKDFEELTTAELDRLVSEAVLTSDKSRRTSEELEALLRESADRRLKVAEGISKIELALAVPRSSAQDGDGGPLADAIAEATIAGRTRLEEELRTLAEREATFELRLDLLRAEAAVARIKSAHASAQRETLEQALNTRRAAEAAAEVKRANEALKGAIMETPAFGDIARATIAIRQGNLEVAGGQQALSDRRQKVEKTIQQFTDRFDITQERVKEPSLARANGLRLRAELRDIKKECALELAAPDWSADLTKSQVKLSQVTQKLELLREDRDWIEVAVRAATDSGQPEADARTLANKMHADYVAALQDTGEALGARIEVLSKLSAKRAELGRLLDGYDAFVVERVLWIQSSEPAWRVRVSDLEDEARAALALEPWRAMRDSLDAGRSLPTTAIISLIALLVLFAARPRLRRALVEEGELGQQRTQVSIRPTLRALVLSVLLAAPYGALLYGLGLVLGQLEVEADQASYVLAFADACCRAAIPLWLIIVMRVLTAKDGLADAHFQWPEEATRLVRRETAWLFAVAPLAAFLAEFFANLSGTTVTDADAMFAPLGIQLSGGAEGLSRIAFLVDLLACAIFSVRVLHPEKGVLAINAGKIRARDMLTRLRRLWFLLLMLAVVVFALAAIFGYGYTARSLFSRLVLSIALLVGIFVARGIALRWIQLELRAEAFEKLRKRREEMREKRLAEIERRRSAGEDVEELESEGLEVEDEEVDVATLSSDVLGLVRVATGFAAVIGVLATCSTVLPALGVFDRVQLWQREVVVSDPMGATGAVAGSSGGAAGTMQQFTTYEWVTLENLGLAGLILLLMWLAIRDIPSLLEFMVLRRLQLGSGERYAITTLLRYLITVVGLALAFDELGLSWSKLQWLVAGVSVGLGFGLQEIFANFVSGITLLFERPVRVGDWVTLGEIEGVVSKIRIRATTIRDRDLKELIVPNREFITGRFINWTLSDPVSRVVLTVGVAYGSDTEKAIQLLLEAGRGCTYSVAEPAPNVVFNSFGGSSLDFELRVFVAGREIKPRVVHDLHMRVDAAFREAGIEIAFPQQDLHLRTVPTGNGPLEAI